jgi:hypothetical protein
MKHLHLAGLALAGLALAGCSSTGGAQLGEKALGNLEYCERSYTAVLGGLGSNGGSINIRCPARPFPPAATTAAP